MRIIAGALGGRQFSSPRGHRTHPMSEKMRGALFNILGDIEGLEVLDPFSGSGALSLEAISRGAKQAVSIDEDKEAYQAIVKNVDSLKLNNKISVIYSRAGNWLRNRRHIYFDLVLLDPPYERINEILLTNLSAQCKVGGIVVISLPRGDRYKLKDDLYEKLSHNNYGDGELHFYKKL